jgi:hypothetical protein
MGCDAGLKQRGATLIVDDFFEIYYDTRQTN